MNEILTVSVSQINNYIKRVFDANNTLSDIWVRGELSNVKLHFSGHIYMTLKDEKSSIRTVMFKSDALSLRFQPENGMRVLVRGRVSVYERDGQYQLYAREMQPDGVGALFIAFEQLKERLGAEGLFDEEYKKPLPEFPETVGVVTAATGAAVRDILNILKRRYPLAEVRVFPVLVQGAQAAGQIAEAIAYIDEKQLADVIILGRGGGSIEDLWAFNEEIVARAIFGCKIPVISAVGHETDFTIADFAADLRAPTPSAAAELAVPSAAELSEKILSMRAQLSSDLIRLIAYKKNRLTYLSGMFTSAKILARIADSRQYVDSLVKSLTREKDRITERKRAAHAELNSKLDALSPLKILTRGYCVAECGGKILKSSGSVERGEKINVRLADGGLNCTVDEVIHNA